MSVRPKNFNAFVKPNTFNMFEMNICRALILVGVKIEGWRTFDRIIGKKHQVLSCLVNNVKHGAKRWGPGTFGPS